jgi:hypothetical protein
VEGATDPTLLVAAVIEIGAAMRAVRLDDADAAIGIAERQQLLAEDLDLLGRPIALG